MAVNGALWTLAVEAQFYLLLPLLAPLFVRASALATFAAFALADVVTIKSVGVGMAIAVALDATIIRVLLVPATMRLLGRWNWWAPGILGRLADGLGFSHVEDDNDVPEPAPVAA